MAVEYWPGRARGGGGGSKRDERKRARERGGGGLAVGEAARAAAREPAAQPRIAARAAAATSQHPQPCRRPGEVGGGRTRLVVGVDALGVDEQQRVAAAGRAAGTQEVSPEQQRARGRGRAGATPGPATRGRAWCRPRPRARWARSTATAPWCTGGGSRRRRSRPRRRGPRRPTRGGTARSGCSSSPAPAQAAQSGSTRRSEGACRRAAGGSGHQRLHRAGPRARLAGAAGHGRDAHWPVQPGQEGGGLGAHRELTVGAGDQGQGPSHRFDTEGAFQEATSR